MKVYIGASFSSRERLRPIRDRIWALGHEVVSTWIDEVAKPGFMGQDEFNRKLAVKDFCEVSSASLVIIDTVERSSTGGSDSEFGFAFGQFHKKSVWVVGPKRSVFHQLADAHFEDWSMVLAVLGGYNGSH